VTLNLNSLSNRPTPTSGFRSLTERVTWYAVSVPPRASDVEICNFVNSKYEISPKLFFFHGLIALKSYVPSKTHTRKAHPWDVDYAPKRFPFTRCPKLRRLSCSLITNTPRKYEIFSCFGFLGPGKFPAQKFGNFLPVYACGQNRCRISGRESALYW